MAGLMEPPTVGMQQPNEYITLAEVSRLLRHNERTIRNWVDKKGLPCVKPGHKLLFEWAKVKRWAEEHGIDHEAGDK